MSRYDETKILWLNSVILDGPTRQRTTDTSLMFGLCKAGEDRFAGPWGKDWVEGTSKNFSNEWSTSCGAGGWMSTAQDMVRLMEALRGEQVLSPENTAQLFRTDFKDVKGSATVLGWEPAETVVDNGDLVLSKNGSGAGRPATALLVPRRWWQAGEPGLVPPRALCRAHPILH